MSLGSIASENVSVALVRMGFSSSLFGERIVGMTETLFEMVNRIVERGGTMTRRMWSVTWRLYSAAGPHHRTGQEEDQILALCSQSKREHYERLYPDLHGALKAFADGVPGDKDERFCIHCHLVEVDDDDQVVSRQEMDRRGGWCV